MLSSIYITSTSSLIECIASWGCPMSTVRILNEVGTIGLIVEPDGMSFLLIIVCKLAPAFSAAFFKGE